MLLSVLEDVAAPLRKQCLCSMSPFSTCRGVVEAGRRAKTGVVAVDREGCGGPSALPWPLHDISALSPEGPVF